MDPSRWQDGKAAKGWLLVAASGWLLAAAGGLRAESSTSPPGTLREVVVIFKTHFDIGYTHLAREVVDWYRTDMIDKALAVCDASAGLPAEQRFVWTLPAWPMRQMLWPGQDSARRERIEQAIRSGQFVWHGLPATLHTESLDLEDLVRGLGHGSSLSRTFGQSLPGDAKMTDVPSHGWVLPTVLANAGVGFLHLGCNGASPPPDVPTLFWWEGPDGSRVLVMQSASYGSGLVPPADWPHATWLALIHTKDNEGPPPPDVVEKVLEEATTKLPGVRVRLGRLSDFADALLAERPVLPVVRADMPDTWIHGIGSMPVETALAGRVRPSIAAAESLHTLLRCWGVGPGDVAGLIAAAYEQSLMFGEHTWGMDVKKFGPRLYGPDWVSARQEGRYQLLEASWAEHGAYIRRAEALVEPVLAAGLEKLASAVATEGDRVVVFNPLPWPRDGYVDGPAGAPAPVTVEDIATHQKYAVEATAAGWGFVARDVPGLGYRTYAISGEGAAESHDATPADGLSWDAASRVMENSWLRLELDPATGTVRSLVDKASQREWVDASAGFGLGQYLYERADADRVQAYFDAYCRPPKTYRNPEGDFGKPGLPPASQVPAMSASPTGWTLTASRSPVAVRARMSAEPGEQVPHAVSLEVALYRDLPVVDLTWSIVDKPADPWPEAGWLVVPFKVAEPRYRLGRLGAVIDPTRDIQPGANQFMACLNSGLAVREPGGAGVAMSALGAPLVSLGEPGLWKYARQRTIDRPTVLVNLYNNQWATNFAQWIEGSWQVTVRLWLTEPGSGDEAMIGPAWEARSPLRAGYHRGSAGIQPVTQSGIELSRRGVLVTAFGPNPDGPGRVLRLWEQIGQDGPCEVRLPAGLRETRVQPCDLRGEPTGEAFETRDGRFSVKLRPFAPVSFIMDAY